MSKTSRFSAVFLALVLTLTTLLAFYTAPHRVMAEGITGEWKTGEEGNTFVIGGDEYEVSADASYSKKVITYMGTKYYLISNAEDFDLVNPATDSADGIIQVNAILTDNITFTSRTAQGNAYALNLEGNNKTITFGNDCTKGLYGTFTGTIQNLTLAGSITIPAAHFGAIAIWWKGGTLTNVNSGVDVTLTGNNGNIWVGGFFGNAQGPTFGTSANPTHALSHCTVSGSITNSNTNTYLGGFAGGVNANLKFKAEYCENSGTITDTGATSSTAFENGGVGGILGCTSNGTTILDHCTNSGNISNGVCSGSKNVRYLGGLIGNARGGTVTITNSENTGDLTAGQDGAGGLVGNAKGGSVSISDSANRGDISNSVSFGNSGGIVGRGSVALTITRCENHGTIAGTGSSTGGLVGYYGTTTITISNSTNYGEVSSSGGVVAGFVAKPDGGVTISDSVNNGAITANGSSNVENTSAAGFVGAQRSGKTTNLSNCVNNGNITVAKRSGYVGGLVAAADHTGATVIISGCTNTGALSTTGALPGTVNDSFGGAAGGLVGGTYAKNANAAGTISITISNSQNTGSVTANGTVLNHVGGLIGLLGHGATVTFSIENSINTGAIANASTEGKTGGFIGYTNKDYTVRNSYSAGVLTGSDLYAVTFADGEVTATVNGAIANSTNNPNATVGMVKSPAAFAAGEIAYLLNTAADETLWYQTIGEDASPVLLNTHATVYQVDLKVGETAVGKTYSNTDAPVALALTTTVAYRSEEPIGMRWTTRMDAYQAEVLEASGAEYKLGTLISPKQYVDAAGGLTQAKLLALLSNYGKDDLSLVAFDLEATDWYGAVSGQFAGSLVNVKEANRNLQFCGVGYLTVNGETVYADPVVAVYSNLAGN